MEVCAKFLKSYYEENQMKKFRLVWLSGEIEVVEGSSISDAFRRAGYEFRALDYYVPMEN